MKQTSKINIKRFVLLSLLLLLLINGLVILSTFLSISAIQYMMILPTLTISSISIGIGYLWTTHNKTNGFAFVLAGVLNLIIWSIICYFLSKIYV